MIAQVGVVGVVGVAVVAQMDLKVQAIVKYYQSCSKLRVHVSVVLLFCVSMRQDVLQCNSRLDCRGSLIPRLSRDVNMYRRESLVSFLRKHDVIKIGPKQKDSILRVVQPTMLQHSIPDS